MAQQSRFQNPFRPGAGIMPPYLAGREQEFEEMQGLLAQDPVLKNVLLTGLRGVGKTVLLESYRPLAQAAGWVWVGSELSETASVSESSTALRLLTDLSVVTAGLPIESNENAAVGFLPPEFACPATLGFDSLQQIYNQVPGLPADKLKAVMMLAVGQLQRSGAKGVVFAYDEAQSMTDHEGRGEFPLSLLLDVFQYLQRRECPVLLVLTGLPTLFPNLVKTRTYSERMFHIQRLGSLSPGQSKDAITKPVERSGCPIKLSPEAVETIVDLSGGYPYFIQFICREAYDNFLRGRPSVPVQEIERKLDADFFEGRWGRATDRQRQILWVISQIISSGEEFTGQAVVEKSGEVLPKPFTTSHTNQMLNTLCEHGFVFRNRHGKYILAVPLLDRFIRRQKLDFSTIE